MKLFRYQRRNVMIITDIELTNSNVLKSLLAKNWHVDKKHLLYTSLIKISSSFFVRLLMGADGS